MSRHLRLLLACALCCGAGHVALAAGRIATTAVDAAFVASAGIRVGGKLDLARRVTDADGEHLLVLSRRMGPSQDKDVGNPGVVERVDLLAAFYHREGDGQWKQEWTIRDDVDCPNLDMEGRFFTKDVTFTDLNGDGRVEVTVPYMLECNGGVDPFDVKVILREGPTKLAVRGQSTIVFQGHASDGGEHTFDAALSAPGRAAYKAHLDKIWKKVSYGRR